MSLLGTWLEMQGEAARAYGTGTGIYDPETDTYDAPLIVDKRLQRLPSAGWSADQYAAWWRFEGSRHLPANGGTVVCLDDAWWFTPSPEVLGRLRRKGIQFPLAVRLYDNWWPKCGWPTKLWWNGTPGTFPVLGGFRHPRTGLFAMIDWSEKLRQAVGADAWDRD